MAFFAGSHFEPARRLPNFDLHSARSVRFLYFFKISFLLKPPNLQFRSGYSLAGQSEVRTFRPLLTIESRQAQMLR